MGQITAARIIRRSFILDSSSVRWREDKQEFAFLVASNGKFNTPYTSTGFDLTSGRLFADILVGAVRVNSSKRPASDSRGDLRPSA